MLRSPRLRTALMAVALYGSLAFYAFYPLPFHLSEVVTGDHTDGAHMLWGMWWTRHAIVELGQSPFFSDWLYYPLGVNLAYHDMTMIWNVLAIPLLPVLGLYATFNIFVMSSILLTGLTTFWLACVIGIGRAGALFAGVAGTWSGYHLSKAVGHFTLMQIEWIPAFWACLILSLRTGRWYWWALTGVALALNGYSHYYYIVYCALLGIVYAVGWLVANAARRWPWREGAWPGWWLVVTGMWMVPMSGTFFLGGGLPLVPNGEAEFKVLYAGLAVGLGLLGIAQTNWHALFENSGGPVTESSVESDIGRITLGVLISGVVFILSFFPILIPFAEEYEYYASDVSATRFFTENFQIDTLDFVIPGGMSRRNDSWFIHLFGLSHHVDVLNIERGMYVGLLSLLVGVIGVVSHGKQAWVWALLGVAIFFFLCSCGYAPKVNGQTIHVENQWAPLPFRLLAELPAFQSTRVSGRYGLITILCSALLAGFGTDAIASKIRNIWGARFQIIVLGFVLVAMVSIHLWDVRGRLIFTPVEIPGYAMFLAEQNPPGRILNLPFGMYYYDARNRWYPQQLAQAWHQRKMIGGRSGRYPEQDVTLLRTLPIYEELLNIYDATTEEQLLWVWKTRNTKRARLFLDQAEVQFVILHLDNLNYAITYPKAVAIWEFLQEMGEWEQVYCDESVVVLKPLWDRAYQDQPSVFAEDF